MDAADDTPLIFAQHSYGEHSLQRVGTWQFPPHLAGDDKGYWIVAAYPTPMLRLLPSSSMRVFQHGTPFLPQSHTAFIAIIGQLGVAGSRREPSTKDKKEKNKETVMIACLPLSHTIPNAIKE
ncbi:hypothetical protein BN1723_016153 [Verticillium longisporum]|uniref:Uncharacterized protein n=1 Tax=Verticillium longisporum TaxID=100787 RepID=A0A0G4NA52_VERLO|nr:hypothetical protein BN1723_016153 [Verticillium longisporum]